MEAIYSTVDMFGILEWESIGLRIKSQQFKALSYGPGRYRYQLMHAGNEMSDGDT